MLTVMMLPLMELVQMTTMKDSTNYYNHNTHLYKCCYVVCAVSAALYRIAQRQSAAIAYDASRSSSGAAA
jgi:hypothetical protein